MPEATERLEELEAIQRVQAQIGVALGRDSGEKTDYQGLTICPAKTIVFYKTDQKELYKKEQSQGKDHEGREILAGLWFQETLSEGLVHFLSESNNSETR